MLELSKYINIFLVVADILIGVHVFNEINSSNPYKYKRASISIGLAACFAIMLSSDTKLVLSASTVALILIVVQQIYDFKDTKFSVNRLRIKYNNRHLRK